MSQLFWATQLGNHLVVYGGLDDFSNKMNDVQSLDLVSGRWTCISPLSSIAHHSDVPCLSRAKAVMVAHKRQQVFKIDEIPEALERRELLKFEGLLNIVETTEAGPI